MTELVCEKAVSILSTYLEPGTYILNVSANGHQYNDTVMVTVGYGDVEFVEIILYKDVREPDVGDEEIDMRLLIVLIVIITISIVVIIIVVARRNMAMRYED